MSGARAAIVASIAALTAALIVAKRRRLLRRFRQVGAIDGDHAATLRSLGLSPSASFKRLVREEVFVAVSKERYYLDENVAYLLHLRRRVRALIVTGIVVLTFLLLWFSGLTRS